MDVLWLINIPMFGITLPCLGHIVHIYFQRSFVGPFLWVFTWGLTGLYSTCCPLISILVGWWLLYSSHMINAIKRSSHDHKGPTSCHLCQMTFPSKKNVNNCDVHSSFWSKHWYPQCGKLSWLSNHVRHHKSCHQEKEIMQNNDKEISKIKTL